MQQRRRPQAFRFGADFVPERAEELQVGLEFIFGAALPGGADNEASCERAFVFQDDVSPLE